MAVWIPWHIFCKSLSIVCGEGLSICRPMCGSWTKIYACPKVLQCDGNKGELSKPAKYNENYDGSGNESASWNNGHVLKEVNYTW